MPAPTSAPIVQWDAFIDTSEGRLVLLVDDGVGRAAWDMNRTEALSLARLLTECAPELTAIS